QVVELGGPVVGDQDVGGRQVAVEDLALEQPVQGGGQVDAHFQRLAPTDLARWFKVVEDLRQTAALDQFLGDPAIVAGGAGGEPGDQVVFANFGDSGDCLAEALEFGLVGGEIGRYDFERDFAVAFRVAGAKHGAEVAATEHRTDFKMGHAVAGKPVELVPLAIGRRAGRFDGTGQLRLDDFFHDVQRPFVCHLHCTGAHDFQAGVVDHLERFVVDFDDFLDHVRNVVRLQFEVRVPDAKDFTREHDMLADPLAVDDGLSVVGRGRDDYPVAVYFDLAVSAGDI